MDPSVRAREHPVFGRAHDLPCRATCDQRTDRQQANHLAWMADYDAQSFGWHPGAYGLKAAEFSPFEVMDQVIARRKRSRELQALSTAVLLNTKSPQRKKTAANVFVIPEDIEQLAPLPPILAPASQPAQHGAMSSIRGYCNIPPDGHVLCVPEPPPLMTRGAKASPLSSSPARMPKPAESLPIPRLYSSCSNGESPRPQPQQHRNGLPPRPPITAIPVSWQPSTSSDHALGAQPTTSQPTLAMATNAGQQSMKVSKAQQTKLQQLHIAAIQYHMHMAHQYQLAAQAAKKETQVHSGPL